ncbi:MAG: HEAT repeat domain-containing protein [Planctomycetota bacterium]|nr:HEAT repeat domain-containing protein [Planctomycetota bacterium]
MLRPKTHAASTGSTSVGASIRIAAAVFALVAGCLVQSSAGHPSAGQADKPEGPSELNERREPDEPRKPDNEIVEPQLLWRHDPELRMPARVRRVPASFLQLWTEALAGPEYELRRDVAMNITRAHSEGYLDGSTTADALANALKDASSPRSVIVEISRALIALDARSSSAKFKELLDAGPGMQFEMIVEPSLARWGDADMFLVWKQRLTAGDVPRYRRLLAIRSIENLPRTMTTDEELHAELASLVSNGRDNGISLEAARVLGQVQLSGLELLAEQLLFSTGSASQTEVLAGVYLLLHHESELSEKLFRQTLTASLDDLRKAPIVRLVWRRLLERNVAELSAIVPKAIGHSDPEVRRVAIDTLVQFPSEEQIVLLGNVLDDEHPEIRRAARHALLTLSEDNSLKPVAIEAGLAAIARSSWREQEQAIVLLAILNQTQTADRLLELMDSPRPEVAIAAAWGLRKLNVAGKLERLLAIAEAMDSQVADGQDLRLDQLIVLAHVFEALGRGKYKPAIPLLKRWIPKAAPRVNYDVPRSSAIWSLGWLVKDSKDVALARQLKDRFVDVQSPIPESTAARIAAGVALGRIGAVEFAPELKTFAELGNGEPDLAAAWAGERLTGEKFPRPKPEIDEGAPWSVVPLGTRLEQDASVSSVN